MKYRREIDGMRGLAILLVLFFHAKFNLLSGGFIGVDIFFVISGYLVTALIFNAKIKNNFSLISFYLSRARRILPALYIVLFFSIIAAFFFYSEVELKKFSKSLVSISFFASNIFFSRNSSYFNPESELFPLLHTWSLSIEEQFYFLFPIILFALSNFSRLKLLVVFVFLSGFSFFLFYSIPLTCIKSSFYFLSTRSWELLFGALVAISSPITEKINTNKWVNEILGFIGLFLILYPSFNYTHASVYNRFYNLIPVTGTVFILIFAVKESLISKIIGNRFFVTIGLMSYGIYLWHQPIFAFSRTLTFNQLNLIDSILVIVITFIVSYISYRYIEMPIRRGHCISKKNFIFLASSSFIIVLTLGLYICFYKEFSSESEKLSRSVGDYGIEVNLTQTQIQGFRKMDAKRSIDILFFGDSHALSLIAAANSLYSQGLNVGFLAEPGCPPIPDVYDDSSPICYDLFSRLKLVLDIEKNIQTVLVAGYFNGYFIEQTLRVPLISDNRNFYYKSKVKHFFREGKGVTEALGSLKNFLDSLALYKRVILIGDCPSSISFNPSIILAYKKDSQNKYFKSRYPHFEIDTFPVPLSQSLLNKKIKKLVGPNVIYLDLLNEICPDGKCFALDERGWPIYRDNHHLRSNIIIKRIAPIIKRAL